MVMYKLALGNVIAKVRKEGYITFDEVEDFLQDQINEFERPYYAQKYPSVDPFSNEFVDVVFDEFHEQIKSLPSIIVRKFIPSEEDEYPEVVYGFDEKHMNTGYLKRKARKGIFVD